MRLHRFYIQTELNTGTEITVNDSEHLHQWVSVFRFTTGDSIILFNGNGNEYTGTFTEIHKKNAVINIISETRSLISSKEKSPLHLYLALIKKDLFELVVEKVTELGVSSITPIITERTQNKNLNMDRLQKIAIEASEQSGRGDVPHINEPVSLHNALDLTKSYSVFVADLNHTGDKDSIKNLSRNSKVLFIGPEGGWGEKDYALFKNYSEINMISLGETTLRAETAAIVGCFMLLK